MSAATLGLESGTARPCGGLMTRAARRETCRHTTAVSTIGGEAPACAGTEQARRSDRLRIPLPTRAQVGKGKSRGLSELLRTELSEKRW